MVKRFLKTMLILIEFIFTIPFYMILLIVLIPIIITELYKDFRNWIFENGD